VLGRSLVGEDSSREPDIVDGDEDMDVPEEVETILDEHFHAIQDKVRGTYIALWSPFLFFSRTQSFDGLQLKV